MEFEGYLCDLELGIEGYAFEPLYGQNEERESDGVSDSSCNDFEEERIGNRDWCECNNCEIMVKQVECVCCQEWMVLHDKLDSIDCITDHQDFRIICLHPAVLETAFVRSKFNKTRGRFPDQLTNRQSRLIAYRQFVCWAYRGEKLGKGKRIVIPSCVVTAIRKEYPEETGTYVGYREYKDAIEEMDD